MRANPGSFPDQSGCPSCGKYTSNYGRPGRTGTSVWGAWRTLLDGVFIQAAFMAATTAAVVASAACGPYIGGLHRCGSSSSQRRQVSSLRLMAELLVGPDART
jgi:hypothetical protein